MFSHSDSDSHSRITAFDAFVASAKLQRNPYQRDAVEWAIRHELNDLAKQLDLNSTHAQSVRGGILADDMGLGKTIIMIGIMAANSIGRTLIVLPIALLQQWHDAIFNLTTVKPFILTVNTPISKNTRSILLRSDVVLTTYSSLVSFSKQSDSLLHTIRWRRVIFDEAHHLRNPNTDRHRAAYALTTSIVWLVSGTPIQNRLADFRAISNILRIRCSESNIATVARHFLLRRTKLHVGIILPPISFTTVVVPWNNPKEKRVAMDIHSRLNCCAFPEKDDTDADTDSDAEEDEHYDPPNTLTNLLHARQACIMPSLVSSTITHSSKIDAVVHTIVSTPSPTGKLVFCNYTKEIDLLYNSLRTAAPHLTIAIYDGRPCNHSLHLTADVLILQIMTGSEGLNLQHNYSHVYFVSPHWNPYIEDQAVARCFRIGQTHPVQVFRFVMDDFSHEKEEKEEKDTTATAATTSHTQHVEHYIHHIQSTKRHIVANAFDHTTATAI